jgi:integrase
MGSITPYDTTAGKRYRVRYRKPDHSQTDKRGFKTKREAQLFLASIDVSKSRGEYIDAATSRITIDELGKSWLAGQTHLKSSSYAPVEIAWRVHVAPTWGNRAIGEIRHSEVQQWVSAITTNRSATTVIRSYGVLAGILDTAVKDKRLLSNPARGVNLPRKSSKKRLYLTHTQVELLASNAKDKETLIRFMTYTGLRWGEARALRLTNVDLNRRRVNIEENA